MEVDSGGDGGSSSGCEPMLPDEPDTSSLCGESSASTSDKKASKAAKKEPDRHTLRRLQALIKVLLESPSTKAQFDLDHVKQSVFKGCSFSEEELKVALKLINFLRPFVPRRWKSAKDKDYRQHTPHVTLRAPLAIISNAVLRLLGRDNFTRRIAPHVAAGDLHGLQLGAAQVFDALCSSTAGHYDVVGIHGDISNFQDVTSPRENKGMVFQGFFNMGRVESICREHGFQFGQRYVLSFQTHLGLGYYFFFFNTFYHSFLEWSMLTSSRCS